MRQTLYWLLDTEEPLPYDIDGKPRVCRSIEIAPNSGNPRDFQSEGGDTQGLFLC